MELEVLFFKQLYWYWWLNFLYPRFKKFLLSGMLETCKRLKLLNLVYTIKCFDIFCLAFICSCIQYPVCMSKWVAVNDRGFPEGSTAFALSSWTLCKNYYSQSTWEYAFHFRCQIFAKKSILFKTNTTKILSMWWEMQHLVLNPNNIAFLSLFLT